MKALSLTDEDGSGIATTNYAMFRVYACVEIVCPTIPKSVDVWCRDNLSHLHQGSAYSQQFWFHDRNDAMMFFLRYS